VVLVVVFGRWKERDLTTAFESVDTSEVGQDVSSVAFFEALSPLVE
jgi:hypothetical protein